MAERRDDNLNRKKKRNINSLWSNIRHQSNETNQLVDDPGAGKSTAVFVIHLWINLTWQISREREKKKSVKKCALIHQQMMRDSVSVTQSWKLVSLLLGLNSSVTKATDRWSPDPVHVLGHLRSVLLLWWNDPCQLDYQLDMIMYMKHLSMKGLCWSLHTLSN